MNSFCIGFRIWIGNAKTKGIPLLYMYCLATNYLPPVSWRATLFRTPCPSARRWAAGPQDGSLCSWTYPLFLQACRTTEKKTTLMLRNETRLISNWADINKNKQNKTKKQVHKASRTCVEETRKSNGYTEGNKKMSEASASVFISFWSIKIVIVPRPSAPLLVFH